MANIVKFELLGSWPTALEDLIRGALGNQEFYENICALFLELSQSLFEFYGRLTPSQETG